MGARGARARGEGAERRAQSTACPEPEQAVVRLEEPV